MQADLFDGADSLTVKQTRELLEIFTGFEQRNRFSIDLDGKPGALHAAEEDIGWRRVLLGSMRPYRLVVMGASGKPVLRLDSPFRWIHRETFVTGPDGKPFGRVRKRFTFLRTRYDVYDAHDRPLFEIQRGIVKVWTFPILRDGREVAVITKVWSGLGRETFSDADRFQLQFREVRDATERMILLGALLLIDFVHFEDSGGG